MPMRGERAPPTVSAPRRALAIAQSDSDIDTVLFALFGRAGNMNTNSLQSDQSASNKHSIDN